jgi:hypothetical protein
LDINYSNIFNVSKEGTTQNDEVFYEKFENLHIAKNKSITSLNSDSMSSSKADFYLNKDVLNMLNSSTISKPYNKISSDSILSSISVNDRRSEGNIS